MWNWGPQVCALPAKSLLAVTECLMALPWLRAELMISTLMKFCYGGKGGEKRLLGYAGSVFAVASSGSPCPMSSSQL